MRARDPQGPRAVKSVRTRSISAREAADEPPVSVHRQDARHEIDQVQGREGGTAGTSEGEAERAGV
jgi:hypothetical protein